MVVLLEDECHLLWGDVCGYAWGPRNQPLQVPMVNQKQRQTYYGALNFVTGQLHLKAFAAGNSQHTVAYLQWLQELYAGKKLLLLWDGATYHRDGAMKEFLAQVNEGLAEEDWRITLCRFAPNAPEQNPVEDVWLAAKNHLRRSFAQNKTFDQVKAAFCGFLQHFSLQSVKFDWYAPDLRIT
jgi:transposase